MAHHDVADLIEKLRANPELLYELPPGQFEEIVAELLASFGWQVNLTSQKWDSGRDILAVSRDSAGFETSWAVECKRWAPSRKVDVATVRSLYGAQRQFGFSKALLVTTSSPTMDAAEFAELTSDLHIVGRERLIDWLSNYRRRPGQRPFAETNRFCSCFVSYSQKDEKFVSYLVARLRAAGVKVWYAPEDLVPGKKLDEEIAHAIRTFDKLLVILSVNSMNSEWVRTEIRKARRREVDEQRRVLFPVALVSFEALKRWELFDADLGQDLAIELRQYFIPDMSAWHIANTFNSQFSKILDGLRT
jgi:hypothetical protein